MRIVMLTATALCLVDAGRRQQRLGRYRGEDGCAQSRRVELITKQTPSHEA